MAHMGYIDCRGLNTPNSGESAGRKMEHEMETPKP